MSVRTRLTLIYAALFLAGGTALLALTYGLVAASLPANHVPIAKPVLSKAQYAKLCTRPLGPVPQKSVGPSPSPAQVPNPKFAKQCEESSIAYRAGLTAGSVTQRQRALHDLLVFSLAGLGVMTLASGGAGWVISGRILRPVRVITATARRASDEHLGERIAMTGQHDELRELADTFDDMLERLDRAFTAQRRFVADASHELRTPLTVMRTAIDVALAKPGRTAEQLEAMAVRVRRAIERAERLIDALLTLAVSDQGTLARTEPLDLATVAEDVLDAAAAEIGRLGLAVTADLQPAVTTGNLRLIERMVGNLVENAVRHNLPGGSVGITSGMRDSQPFVRIVNTGPAVPPAEMESLFQPFRRLGGRSADGDGAGLGLAIAQSIAAAHGSAVRAQPQPGGGLDVEVVMPGMPEWSSATA